MRRFRRFRMVGAGFLKWLVFLTAFGFLGLKLADLILMGPLVAVAETEARQRSAEVISRVALGAVGKGVKADELVTFVRDQQGKIAAYHVNTPLVNTMASEVAVAVQQHMRSPAASQFDVPMGALSQSRFLSTYGPNIPVRMLPIGTITVEMKQAFTSAGVNQTNHRIWLHARAQVRIVLPIVSREMEVTYDFPISDTVIVGDVPQYYGGKLDSVTVPAGR